MSAGVPTQMYAGAAFPTATVMAPASYSPTTTTMATQLAVAAPASYAAPVTTIMAAPASYAAPMTVAAPASYAAPMTMAAPVAYAAPASYAAPMMTTMAAPTVTTMMAAPASYAPVTTQTASYVPAPQAMQVMTQAPSYVAAPQVMAAPYQQLQQQQVMAAPAFAQQQLIPAVAPPAPPVKLTQGIPTPDQIQQQRVGYAAALDKQLKEAVDTVQKETAIEKEMLKFTAEKNIALNAMQVDERMAESLAFADEGATIRILELKKALVERKLQLDNQAQGLMMDYQMKSLQTDFAQKTFAFQQQYVKSENALAQDYNKQVAAANTGTTYSVPAQAVQAPPAAAAPAPKK